ncbi:MAG: flagellar hook-length control protein FliK [Spirochaetales bacterium]|nr:flagellar hook-length control protein FliK [Spirochaetales bacterium]
MVDTAPKNLLSAESPKQLSEGNQAIRHKYVKDHEQKGLFSELLAGFEKKIEQKSKIPINKMSLGEILQQLKQLLAKGGDFSEIQKSPENKQILQKLLKSLMKTELPDDSGLKDVVQLLKKKLNLSESGESSETDAFAAVKSWLNALELGKIGELKPAVRESDGKNNREALEVIKNKVELVDLRKNPKESAALAKKVKADENSNDVKVKNALPETEAQKQVSQKESRDFQVLIKDTMDLNQGAESFKSFGKQEGFSLKNSEMLQSLKERFQTDLVRHTKFVLKEGNQGEIRLVLKPENLGRVTMRVNLNQNHIEGRIFVENNTVKEIINSSLSTLADSLKSGGYESVALEVSVGQQYQDQDRSNHQPQVLPFTDSKSVQEEFDKNQIEYDENAAGVALVNVVV